MEYIFGQNEDITFRLEAREKWGSISSPKHQVVSQEEMALSSIRGGSGWISRTISSLKGL